MIFILPAFRLKILRILDDLVARVLMQKNKQYLFWLLLVLGCYGNLSAQNAGIEDRQANSENYIDSTHALNPPVKNSCIVRDIIIIGNKKTRAEIILREIPFKTGETYLLPDLVKKFDEARRRLMNTTLFHEAIVAMKSMEGYNIDITVEVKERWYIFPIPYLKPVDRNLNQWIVEQKASLERVNYGVKLLYNNVTGRNDKLKLWVIGGYTKQITFNYDRLYIDKKMKWGMNLAFLLGKNRELNYMTISDKQQFLKSDDYIRNFVMGSAEVTYRNAINTRHRFGISYTKEEVADTVVSLNPDYFKFGKNQVRYPALYYIMTYYNLDYIPYPSKGYAAEIIVQKEGFTKYHNLFQVTAKGSGNWPINERLFFSINAYGTIKLPFSQPYISQRLLGYNDVYLQGYEYYVIDGVAGGYVKAALTRKLVSFNVKFPGIKKLAPQKTPFGIYGRIFGNAGYTHNTDKEYNSTLTNKMLYSAGLGIDITTIYDFTFRIDWSFNQLGENGLFLHKKAVF
jgi:outer membrane protein assembly factor BamA